MKSGELKPEDFKKKKEEEMMETRNITLEYSYNPKKTISGTVNEVCRGSLNRISQGKRKQIDMCLDIGHIYPVDCFVEEYLHPNYLPLRLVDETSNLLLHSVCGPTIEEYVSTLKLRKIEPVMTYNLPCQKGAQQKTYKYVPEEYRKLVKGLVSFVTDLHTKQKSLMELKLRNICVIGGELKVWGVRFRKKPDSELELAAKDFRMVNDLVTEIFSIGGTIPVGIPLDFVDLQSKMSNYSKDFHLGNHFALLTAKEKLHFLKNIGDKIDILTAADKAVFDSLIMTMGSNNGWAQKFKVAKGTNAARGVLGPVVECFNFVKNKGYIDNGTDKIVNGSLVRFARNLATHLWFYLPQYNKKVAEKDLELVIMNEFGKQLTTFHTSLVRKKLIYYFR